MLDKLRILHLEDLESDSILAERILKKDGLDFDWMRVDSQPAFSKAIQEFKPMLILSDYKLPGFDGTAALEMALMDCPEIPFVFLTGTIGEELAVESLKKGAVDCVMKDRLLRLPSCVRRALKQAEDRQERKRLEAQYLQSQKMEVFGQLAGGIAHDFNNLLTVINGYSQLHLMQLPQDDPVRDTLEQINQAGERASRLTRQLLAFSRLNVAETAIVNLNELIANLQKMLARVIGNNIEVSLQPDPKLWLVNVDPGQIEQVIMNLAINARDAMPATGKLVIETCNCQLGSEYVRIKSEVKPGDYAAIFISDTGHGMTREILEKIFEPFFTTKEVGKGTGLGLATCFGIVKQAEGHIDVYSEPGVGTTFKVYLPRYSGSSSVAGARRETVGGSLKGSETVLVVEDDVMVRNFAVKILKDSGYSVLVAEDGEQAFGLLSAKKIPDLMVVDMIMPKMTGDELLQKVKKMKKNPKILFTSGYADSFAIARGALEPHQLFLQKPYSPLALLTKVREALQAK